jgi:hypothetical protein
VTALGVTKVAWIVHDHRLGRSTNGRKPPKLRSQPLMDVEDPCGECRSCRRSQEVAVALQCRTAPGRIHQNGAFSRQGGYNSLSAPPGLFSKARVFVEGTTAAGPIP